MPGTNQAAVAVARGLYSGHPWGCTVAAATTGAAATTRPSTQRHAAAFGQRLQVRLTRTHTPSSIVTLHGVCTDVYGVPVCGSGGATMAVNHLVAFADLVQGLGIIGGSPYGCCTVPDCGNSCSGFQVRLAHPSLSLQQQQLTPARGS